jgi:hypothetical protein
MSTQPPAAPETDVRLTEAERKAWDVDPDLWPHTPPLHIFRALMDEDDNLWWRASGGHGLNAYDAATERIDELAERLRVAEAERDAWRFDHSVVEHWQERAEAAEAALAELRAGVAPTPVPSEVAAPETEAARVHLTPRARLVAHPTPDKVWVQVPHRNDIGSDWIEADPSDWLAAHDAATADRVRREAAAEWVARLSDLCDDEWLRRRDRAMEAPGSKGHRWERRAASAWETAARSVRAILNDLADYEDEYVGRHAAYSRWIRDGRDEGASSIAREQAR